VKSIKELQLIISKFADTLIGLFKL